MFLAVFFGNLFILFVFSGNTVYWCMTFPFTGVCFVIFVTICGFILFYADF